MSRERAAPVPQATDVQDGGNRLFFDSSRKSVSMLVLTRKNRESVVIGNAADLEVMLEITILEIEGGRVRLGFEADTRMPIHRREVWDRICNGQPAPNTGAVATARQKL
jgi:carbon storage regulator CsrA